VEHSFSPFGLAHPWRTATVVASALAAIELVLLVVLAVALVAKPVASRADGAATRIAAAPPVLPKVRKDGKPRLARAETSVLVLNGNGRAGAAHENGDLIRSKGYSVSGVGNADRMDHARSVVMYRKGYAAEAKRLAGDLGGVVVAPLDGLKTSDLMGAHVVFVVAD